MKVNTEQIIEVMNQDWTDIYYHLHTKHDDHLSHQAVRMLQHIEKNRFVTIGHLAKLLEVSHNTASEHVKRLIQKGLVQKNRDSNDERKVYVTLTPEGEEAVKRHTRLHPKKLHKVLEQLNEEEVEMIKTAFSLLSREVKSCF
ncbi:MarR family winged helix-turn-helix transcriptional regulator [Bacillus paralicheniformis]|uniref:MarR family winged helix-turn-helix transcriptional regulator n=1 Tax=Bacillus paralicheniformis TaxID=1648923 RepID=UPI0009B0DC4B|nr:MarR family transcriptional regulator [Bacillus paralicheniformis]ARA84339.1 MarR family transcriptional regulator [Bacillus paralicheniformis]MEC1866932.1 MarR family transcriptional regulator [Bacillus paralicheniformis]PAE02964.1 MarR family transcriptional regulator [Bacillus paralicheniformis]